MASPGAATGQQLQTSVRVGERTYQLTYDDFYGASVGPVFEPSLVRLLTALTPPGTQALDVGANIGLATLALAQLAVRVHSFEVVPSTFALLETNVANAGLSHVVLHDCGLGEQSATVDLLRLHTDRSGAYISSAAPTKDHIVEVGRVEALDSLASTLGPNRVGLVKIDVEGFEIPVLRGARALLERDRPVVVLEMNHWCLNAFQRRSIPDFLDDLRSVFPVLYAVDDASGESRDLYDPDQTHEVMHDHIVRMRYLSVVGAFSPEQVAGLALLPAAVAEADAAVAEAAARQAAAAEAAARAAAEARAAEVAAAEAAAAQTQAALESLRAEHTALQGECTALQGELRAMRATLSWRVTRPLRAVRSRYGGTSAR